MYLRVFKVLSLSVLENSHTLGWQACGWGGFTVAAGMTLQEVNRKHCQVSIRKCYSCGWSSGKAGLFLCRIKPRIPGERICLIMKEWELDVFSQMSGWLGWTYGLKVPCWGDGLEICELNSGGSWQGQKYYGNWVEQHGNSLEEKKQWQQGMQQPKSKIQEYIGKL